MSDTDHAFEMLAKTFEDAMTEGECPDCGGTNRGEWIPKMGSYTPCPSCSGTGKEKA